MSDDEERGLRAQVAALERQSTQQKAELARQKDEIEVRKSELAKLQMLCEGVEHQLELQHAAHFEAQRQETRNRSIAALGDKLDTATSMKLRKDTLTELTMRGISGGQTWLAADLLSSSASLKVTDLMQNNFDVESAELLVEAVKGKDVSLCGLKADQTTADFSRKGLKPPDAMLLASDLSKAAVSGSLTELNLSYNEVGKVGAENLAAALRLNESLTSITLLANEFDDATIAMLHELKEEKPALTTLCGLKPGQMKADFAGWGLSAQVAKLLAPEVVASASLRDVNLDGFPLPIRDLKGAFRAGTQPITTLDFSKKELGTPSSVLIGSLIAVNNSLTSLTLLFNQIGAEGAKPLAEALLVNDSMMEVNLDGFPLPIKWLKGTDPVGSIDFSRKELGVASAVVIGALVGVNRSLTSLNLSENKIGAEGVRPLAEALHTNEALEELNLRLNGIGWNAGYPLAEALRVNETLASLNLSFNELCGVNMRGEGSYNEAGVTAISQALHDKCSLTRLDVSFNHLDAEAEGVQLIRNATERYPGFELIDGCNAHALGPQHGVKAAALPVMAVSKFKNSVATGKLGKMAVKTPAEATAEE